jgi:hypothetical protein
MTGVYVLSAIQLEVVVTVPCEAFVLTWCLQVGCGMLRGMSGGDGGGLYADIYSYGNDHVSNSSMSLTTVTATDNTAAGTMHWALL